MPVHHRIPELSPDGLGLQYHRACIVPSS